jgi:hypothetical protein
MEAKKKKGWAKAAIAKAVLEDKKMAGDETVAPPVEKTSSGRALKLYDGK